MAAAKVDPTKVKEVHVLAMGRGMLSCRFDPSGERVAAGGMNAQLTRTAIKDRKFGPAKHFDGHRTWIAALAYSPDGSKLFSADYGGRLRCTNTKSDGTKSTDAKADDAPIVWSAEAHQGWIRTLAVSTDGRLVASAGNDKLVRVWNAESGKPVRVLSGHADHVYSVAFHPTSGRLVSADLKGAVKEWDVATGFELRNSVVKELFVQQQELRLGGVRALAFDAEGKRLVCGGMSGFGSIGDGIGSPTIVVLDWNSGEAIQTGLPKEATRTFVTGAAFHRDGFVLAATGGLDRGYLLFWKLGQKEKEAFFQFKLPESSWGMDFSPTKNLIVTANHDRQLRLYELPTASV